MIRRKVAVIAGTPVDTRMGVDFINKKNIEADHPDLFETRYCALENSCEAQLSFQYSDYKNKLAKIDKVFDEEIKDGVRDFFIYCNSLSGAFDFETYAEDRPEDIQIYTPLQIFRSIASEFNSVGVIAGNNLSAHSIEAELLKVNPSMTVIGTGNIVPVSLIEAGISAKNIVIACGLAAMSEYMQSCGAQALILGCTHFPYFKDELSRFTSMPLIDPADEMYSRLVRNVKA